MAGVLLLLLLPLPRARLRSPPLAAARFFISNVGSIDQIGSNRIDAGDAAAPACRACGCDCWGGVLARATVSRSDSEGGARVYACRVSALSGLDPIAHSVIQHPRPSSSSTVNEPVAAVAARHRPPLLLPCVRGMVVLGVEWTGIKGAGRPPSISWGRVRRLDDPLDQKRRIQSDTPHRKLSLNHARKKVCVESEATTKEPVRSLNL